MRCPERAAMARAMDTALMRPSKATATAAGNNWRSVCQCNGGSSSSGACKSSAPSIATLCAAPSMASESRLPASMPISIYGQRRRRRRVMTATASVVAAIASVGQCVHISASASATARSSSGRPRGNCTPKKSGNWLKIINIPAPAVKPVTTVGEMKLTSPPRRKTLKPS